MHDDTHQLARTPVMIGCYSKITRDPRKMRTGEGDLYAGGVSSLLLLKDGKLVVGTGDGIIELIEIISRKNGRTKKPSKFPNTPQILAVSCFNPLNTYVKSASTSIFFTDIYSSVACNKEKWEYVFICHKCLFDVFFSGKKKTLKHKRVLNEQIKKNKERKGLIFSQ